MVKVEEANAQMANTISQYKTQIEEITGENSKLKRMMSEFDQKLKDKESKANQELIKKFDDLFAENEVLRLQISTKDNKIEEIMNENKQFLSSMFEDNLNKQESEDTTANSSALWNSLQVLAFEVSNSNLNIQDQTKEKN